MSSLFDRIEYLRKDRAHHTWLGGMGIARDTVKHIKDQTAEPSENVLSIISKCENASFLWLTEGKGSPYRLAKLEHDGECADVLEDLLAQEAWTAYIVDDTDRTAIVLTMASAFQRARSGFIEYTAIEVLSPAGVKAISEAALHASAFMMTTISQEAMNSLVNGELGTYELLGDSKKDGLLSGAGLVSMNDRLELFALPNSLPDVIADTSSPLYTTPVDKNSEEYELLQLFRSLDEESKQLILQVIRKIQ